MKSGADGLIRTDDHLITNQFQGNATPTSSIFGAIRVSTKHGHIGQRVAQKQPQFPSTQEQSR